MHFKLRTFIDRSGHEMSVLVNSNSQPFFWPNVFAAMEFRNKSPKTLAAVLRALGMFELWINSKEYPDSNQLASGESLAMHEAEDLARFLRLNRPAQDEEAGINQAIFQQKVVRLESVRKSKTQTITKNKYAGRVEAANRVRWVAMYLEFLRDRAISASCNQDDQKALERKSNIGINRLKKLAPRGGSYASNEALIGINEEVVHLVRDSLNPANHFSNNLFGTTFLRARNFLIWSLLSETGMRREELVKLKVEDINYPTRRVAIRESKTLPRTVPISESTAESFHNFIMEHWSKLPAKHTAHGRLLIGANGNPLKTGSINLIFTRIRERIPGVPNYLTPHTLRRTWNERYSARIDALPPEQRPSVKEETEIRNRLMGWSDNSQEGARYAKRHIRHKADAIAEELANALTTPEMSTDD